MEESFLEFEQSHEETVERLEGKIGDLKADLEANLKAAGVADSVAVLAPIEETESVPVIVEAAEQDVEGADSPFVAAEEILQRDEPEPIEEPDAELDELAARLEARMAAGREGARLAQENVQTGEDPFQSPPAGKRFVAPETPKPRPGPKPVAKATGPRAEYDAALQLTQKWKSKEARQAFEKFLAEHPNHALVPNALYWMGETHYQEKDYADAVLTFRKVHQRFPKHHKAADSLLKIGYSYRSLGDKENARFYFNVLMEEYPDTRAARIAKANLEVL